MKYVLILMWLNSYHGGAIAMHEFDSLDSCTSAANQALSTQRGKISRVLTALCVPKSK